MKRTTVFSMFTAGLCRLVHAHLGPGPAPRPSAARAGWKPALCVLGLLGALFVVLPAHSGTLDAAHVKETVFPNGLRLIVKEDHAAELASIQVWIRAGGFLENAQTAGTAHMLEHLVFKGTDSRGPGMIDAEVESVGGLLEATTEKDWTRFNCTVAGRYAEKIISVIGDALRNPTLRQEDLDAEKPVVLEEINQVVLSPEASLARALYLLAFQEHPYRHDVRGTPEFLQQLKLDDVRAYYQKHYVPSNMTVVVVGHVDRAAVERAVRASFQADRPAPQAEPQPLPAPERAGGKPQQLEFQTRFANGFVGLAWPAPSVKDNPDVYAMDVLLTMLEHGGSGRLPRLLRGVAAVQATFETRRQAGLFTVMAATGREDVRQVEALIRKEIDAVKTAPIPPAELALAKAMLRGSYALDNETYSGQAGTLGYYASIDRWEFASTYLDKIQAVTAEQVQAAAHKYLDSERVISVILRPRAGAPGAEGGM